MTINKYEFAGRLKIDEQGQVHMISSNLRNRFQMKANQWMDIYFVMDSTREDEDFEALLACLIHEGVLINIEDA